MNKELHDNKLEQPINNNNNRPNNKPDIIIRYNKQGTCMLMGVVIPGDRNVIKKEDSHLEPSQYHSDSTSATYQESTKLRNCKNRHIGHCTQTAESANVKVQNIFHGRNNITCSTNCKYRTAASVYTIETWFVSGI